LDFGSDNGAPASLEPGYAGATTSAQHSTSAETLDATETCSCSNVDVQENPDGRLAATTETRDEAAQDDAVALDRDTNAPACPDPNYMVKPASAHQTTGEPEVYEETVSCNDDDEITGSDLDDLFDEKDGKIVLRQSDGSDSVTDSNDGNFLGEMHPDTTLETRGGQQLASMLVATRSEPSSGHYLPVRSALPTARIHNTFEEEIMSGSQAGPSRVPPAPPQSWRIPHDRTHLELDMNRIHTDYILSNDFIDNINEMLNAIHNWSENRAMWIMKSFRDDVYNEDRKITFFSRHCPGVSLTWNVRIENPNRWTPKTSCVTAKERLQQYMEEGKDGYGDYVPTCPGGCGPQCRPLVRTKEQNEEALARGREVRRQENERKEWGDARERDRELRKTMPPPPLPRWVAGRTEQSSQPSPRPKPLSEEDIAKLVSEPLYPPRSPQPGNAELKLTFDQWKRLEANEPPPMENQGLMGERSRNSPSPSPTTSRVPLFGPRPQTTYVKVTDVAKKRSSSYNRALHFSRRCDSPPEVAARPVSQLRLEETGSDVVNQYRDQLSQTITNPSPEASNKRPGGQIASKRPKKQHQRTEL
jgi:hypothetical protein